MLSSVFLFFSFSGSEIMLILFVALILFGGDKFPEIARGLGKGIREFKDMSDGVKREIHSQINNYDVDNNLTNTTNTTTTQEQQPPVDTAPPRFDEHQTHDTAETPHHDAAQHNEPAATVIHNEPAAATAPEAPAAEKPAIPKPDLTPPANTISHQSY